MHHGWPALTNLAVDGWTVRRSEGVTARANSELPVSSPRHLAGALERVEALHRAHNLPPTFQISPATEPSRLVATPGSQLALFTAWDYHAFVTDRDSCRSSTVPGWRRSSSQATTVFTVRPAV
jgi:hypothetical protein